MIRIQDNLSSNNERGAVYVEATIVLTIFFLFILAIIDLTMVLQQRFAVTSSLRTTARFLSTQTERCTDQATDAFNQNLNRNSFLASVRNTQLRPPAIEVQGGVSGIRLSVDTDYTCIFCTLTFHALSPNLSATVYMPVEGNEICAELRQTT